MTSYLGLEDFGPLQLCQRLTLCLEQLAKIKDYYSMLPERIILVLVGASQVIAGKSLWSSVPATFGTTSNDEYVLKTGYPLGNGKLGGENKKLSDCTNPMNAC